MAIENANYMKRCLKCHGSLRLEREADYVRNVLFLQYVCFNCGLRWYLDEPRPIAA
jgi:hypothetical protein